MVNRLVRSIEDLIVDHDCVIVPNFGAFFQESVPASYSEEYNTIFPPATVVRFNESIQHQDPLLLEYYKVNLGLSRRQAKINLDTDIQNLKQQLIHQQVVTLQGLGKLQLNPEGAIRFSEDSGDYVNMAHYGLKSVSPNSKLSIRLKTEQVRYYLPQKQLKYVGIVAVLLIVLILPFSLWRSQLPSYEASFVPSNTEFSTTTTTPVSQNVSSQSPTNTNYWIEAEEGMHYIIIGVERKKEIAERYITLYKEIHPDLKILQDKKQYRISAKAISNKEEAYRYLSKLKEDNISAWIYAK